MFSTFFRFELRYWLRGFMVYVFTLILGTLVFAATLSDNIQLGGALENSFRNAPYNVQNFYAIMGILSSLMVRDRPTALHQAAEQIRLSAGALSRFHSCRRDTATGNQPRDSACHGLAME